jgi:hypothetical protein
MKNSIGALLIVGGLGIIGYYLLTLTKPKNRESQLAELDKKAKDLATSMIDIDNSDISKAKAIHIEILKIKPTGATTYSTNQVNTLSKEELESLKILFDKLGKLGYYMIGTELRKKYN